MKKTDAYTPIEIFYEYYDGSRDFESMTDVCDFAEAWHEAASEQLRASFKFANELLGEHGITVCDQCTTAYRGNYHTCDGAKATDHDKTAQTT